MSESKKIPRVTLQHPWSGLGEEAPPWFRWACELFAHHLGVDLKLINSGDASIELGEKQLFHIDYGTGDSNEPPSLSAAIPTLYIWHAGKGRPDNPRDYQRCVLEDVPFYFCSGDGSPKFDLNTNSKSIHLRSDVFATIWFLASRVEELDTSQSDEYGRFPDSSAYQVNFNDQKRPVVDQQIELLREKLHELGVSVSKPAPFANTAAAACLTFDLDSIEKFPSLRSLAGYIKRRPNTKGGLAKIIKQYQRNRKGHDPHSELLKKALNDFSELPQTWFLPTGGSHPLDTKFQLNDQRLDSLKEIAQLGNIEVGLHPGFENLENPALSASEKEKLHAEFGHSIQSFRMHYLRARPETLLQVAEATGCLIDSTLGWSTRIGFRCGTAHPFFLYDHENDCASSVLEVPLIVMDTPMALHRRAGSDWDLEEHWSLEEAMRDMEMVLTRVKETGGVFVVLTHPHLAADVHHTDWYAWNERLLGLLNTSGLPLMSISQVADSWKQSVANTNAI
jgi:hypothetical protein